MAEVQKVTQEQAQEAFSALLTKTDPTPEPVAVEPSQAVADEPIVEKVDATKAEEETKEEVQPAKSDDVLALEQRLEAAAAERKSVEERAEARVKAIQQRNAESERILRDRYLRKSTATDKALRVLKAAKTDAGVDPSEADRVIAELEATMNPASVNYAPPEPRGAVGTEEQALILNRFLNEQGMDTVEADKFGNWIRTEAVNILTPSEQAIASESLDGFLHIAHSRWQNAVSQTHKQQVVSDAVAAVKSVQQTQRQAAKAAEVTSSAPKRQTVAANSEVDVRKLTPNDISRLVRQSVEQYR